MKIKNYSKRIITSLFLLLTFAAYTQPVTISVETKDNALVLQTDKDNRLWIVHFGKKMMNKSEYAAIVLQSNFTDANAGIYNSAYTPAGTWSLSEPALQVTHADANPSLDLKYINYF